MRVLVIGGTQFNGFALVRELARTGHDVTILNRGKTDAPLPASIRRLTADRTDHARMKEVLGAEEFDVVQDMCAYRLEDVELMCDILRGRVGHYIFASSTVIYSPSDVLPIDEGFPVDRGERQNEYGMNKLLCEDHLLREYRENGFPGSIVCFSMVFGPRNIIPDREQRMFMRFVKGRKILIPGDGSTLGQIGHVDDQARALRMMMMKPSTYGKRYNLTGDEFYTDHGYVDTFARVVGAEPEKVSIPAELMEDLWAGRVAVTGRRPKTNIDIRTTKPQRDAHLFQLSLIVQRIAPQLHHWNRSTLFSSERLKSDTGWAPEYSFEGAVQQTWDWLRAEGLDRTLEFDWSFEDQLLERLGA
ncbi:MAG: NAD-dependent epimerase/dehydratase family protein [Myxococcales bacterium]|nr:NAD-dependent epimerase/dehydratase family protein [Myxococcales bacterium]